MKFHAAVFSQAQRNVGLGVGGPSTVWTAEPWSPFLGNPRGGMNAEFVSGTACLKRCPWGASEAAFLSGLGPSAGRCLLLRAPRTVSSCGRDRREQGLSVPWPLWR